MRSSASSVASRCSWGGCTLEAAEAVCDADGDLGWTFDGVASLVDKSLLRQEDGPDGEPRFAMLETIREYALEQLQASARSQRSARRHLACCDLAERGQEGIHGPDGVAWIDPAGRRPRQLSGCAHLGLADHDRTSARIPAW